MSLTRDRATSHPAMQKLSGSGSRPPSFAREYPAQLKCLGVSVPFAPLGEPALACRSQGQGPRAESRAKATGPHRFQTRG